MINRDTDWSADEALTDAAEYAAKRTRPGRWLGKDEKPDYISVYQPAPSKDGKRMDGADGWREHEDRLVAPRIVAECWTCDRMPLPQIQNSATPQHLTVARHIAFGHDVRPAKVRHES